MLYHTFGPCKVQHEPMRGILQSPWRGAPTHMLQAHRRIVSQWQPQADSPLKLHHASAAAGEGESLMRRVVVLEHILVCCTDLRHLRAFGLGQFRPPCGREERVANECTEVLRGVEEKAGDCENFDDKTPY